MADGRIPKYVLGGELASDKSGPGRPLLRFQDVCKRDIQALHVDVNRWKEFASDRYLWR